MEETLYNAIAKAFREALMENQNNNEAYAAIYRLADRMTDKLYVQNPSSFNRHQFFAAATGEKKQY